MSRARRSELVAGRPASAHRQARVATGGSSWASSDAVRARMQRQPTRDTAPELAVRSALHAAGLRYRVDAAPLPGLRRRADVVFRPAKVAVFIDGCFWHGCPDHGSRTPHSNPDYWTSKVGRNQARDRDTDQRLQEAGWLVVREWEHQPPNAVAQKVMQAVAARRPARPQPEACFGNRSGRSHGPTGRLDAAGLTGPNLGGLIISSEPEVERPASHGRRAHSSRRMQSGSR